MPLGTVASFGMVVWFCRSRLRGVPADLSTPLAAVLVALVKRPNCANPRRGRGHA